MNAPIIEKPTSTDKVVPQLHLRVFGAEATGKPSRLGDRVATGSPCEEAKADFDQPPWPELEDETWTELKNQRRCDLIDRKYAGGLTPAEISELFELQAQMLRYSHRVAPLPIEAAERLYKKLLASLKPSRLPKDQ